MNWTDKQLAVLREPVSSEEVARRLNISSAAVRGKRQREGIKAPDGRAAQTVTESSSYAADRDRASALLWRKKFDELSVKYQRALHENSVVEHLVAEIRDLAPRSYMSAPPIKKVRPSGDNTAQSGVLLLSDTHVGKVVLPQQTLGFGRYDFPTFLARLKYLEESTVSILQNHTTTQIDELVVAMLGDMLDGALSHGTEAGQRNTLFSQFYQAGHAVAQFLRALSAHVPKIRVKTVVGNHTRWQTQKKMPTENRYSNLDMFFYALVEALTSEIQNIEWDLNTQPFALFEVQGFTFHAAHGDHLRGGDKAMGIPTHAIGREISTKTQLFVKHGRQSPHYYITGHLHRDIQLPHALGDVTVNGGFPGLDNYALAENFNPIDPKQLLFFVHPKYGKTAEYKLSLKFAETPEEPPYVLPESFPVQ